MSVALAARDQLTNDGVGVRVVSMPSWELFDRQDDGYHDAVLPRTVPAVSVEAGIEQGWSRYVDASVSIERFGASAPGAEVMAQLGITPSRVRAVALNSALAVKRGACTEDRAGRSNRTSAA